MKIMERVRQEVEVLNALGLDIWVAPAEQAGYSWNTRATIGGDPVVFVRATPEQIAQWEHDARAYPQTWTPEAVARSRRYLEEYVSTNVMLGFVMGLRYGWNLKQAENDSAWPNEWRCIGEDSEHWPKGDPTNAAIGDGVSCGHCGITMVLTPRGWEYDDPGKPSPA